MHKYIKAAVSLENLRQQVAKPIFEGYIDDFDDNEYGSPEELFRTLVNVDPTADYEANKGGKYVPWIIRQYLRGNLTSDDFTNLQDALMHFNQRPKYYEHTDLGQYKTVKDFLNDAEAVSNRPLTEKEKAKQAMKAAHRAGDADKEYITSDGVWELWTPKTHAGSMSLARWGGVQAKWCTAYEGDYHWNYYTTGSNAKTPLYIFINTSDPGEKYQFHQNSHSWYDINDNSLRMPAFYKFLSDKPVFADFFGYAIVDGYTIFNHQIISLPKDVTEYVLPSEADSIANGVEFPKNTTSIKFPDRWTSLDNFTLITYWGSSLPSLTYIHFPAKLDTIPDSFARKCKTLTVIDFPSNLKHIGAIAFQDCVSLTEVILPNSVVSIGANAFSGCPLTTFRCPDSLSVLKNGILSNHNWEEVDLNKVSTLRSRALESATIKVLRNLHSVLKFGAESMLDLDCASLLASDLNPNASFGHNAFRDCEVLSGTYTITDSSKLGIDSFSGCINLEIMWAASDASYEFDGIKLLTCSNTCTELIAANKGYIPIETIEGEHYDAEI